MNFRKTLFGLMCLVTFSQTATADLVLVLSDDGGATFSNNFNAEVGESLRLGIYLQQTAPDSVLTEDGLASFGFDLVQSTLGAGTISIPVANAAFDFENHNVRTSTGFEWEYVESAGNGIRGNDILLGEFQYDATATGTSIFRIEDRLVGGGIENANWSTASFVFVDEQIFGVGAAETYQFSVNVSAVPEPSSVTLFSFLVPIALIRRRRVVQRVS